MTTPTRGCIPYSSLVTQMGMPAETSSNHGMPSLSVRLTQPPGVACDAMGLDRLLDRDLVEADA